jgi:hypothetical protein
MSAPLYFYFVVGAGDDSSLFASPSLLLAQSILRLDLGARHGH